MPLQCAQVGFAGWPRPGEDAARGHPIVARARERAGTALEMPVTPLGELLAKGGRS